MARAIQLAVENARSGRGGPFAAIVVKAGAILAEGANQVAASNDPTAHAEVVAIRNACCKLNDFRLTGCDMYTTCEPCPMCLGAIYWSRADRVFFASRREDAAAAGFDDALIYQEIQKPFGARKLPMIPLMREDARVAFQTWKELSHRVQY